MMELMRTTINAEDSVLEKAKATAVGRGVTLSELVEDALRSYLSSDNKTPPPPFELHTVKGTLVQPHLDFDRTSALLLTDDESVYGQ